MSPIEILLSKLERVRSTGDGEYMARCPAHDDGTASLSISSGEDGRALVNCFAGCAAESVVEAVGLTMRDLFVAKEKPTKSARASQQTGGVTLVQLATAKGLPIKVLRDAGWRDARYDRKAAVEIPYFHRDGSRARSQFRIALSGEDRFRFGKKGSGEVIAYEPDRGARAKEFGVLVVVEGGTDAIAGMLAGMPVLGLPGANHFKKITATHLEGITQVLYCREPDKGGESLAEGLPPRLRELKYGGALREIRLEGAKDICELHAQDPAKFVERVKAAIKAATSIDITAAVDSARKNTAGDKESADWSDGLITDKEGGVKRCLANTMHVIAKHPAWAGVIAYDAFRENIAKLLFPPVREQDGQSTLGEWTEADSARTASWFASEVGFEPTPSQVETAVATMAQTKVVHEVRDYLDALQWDGEPRLEKMLHTHFGAANTEYTRAIGSRWMTSAVARVKQPGCQADYVLVLEGDQGKGKSTGLEALFGQGLFSDTPPSIGDKDGYQSLRGKWCIEFGELDAIKGKDASRVKNFISARSDNYRCSYGRRNGDHPRQIVFTGSTNEKHYFVDPTGNRRFWPVCCVGEVDVKGLGLIRDQLWAEARVRYERGEPWHMDTPKLRDLCEQAQSSREVEDAWLAPIRTYLFDADAEGKSFTANTSLVERGVTTNKVMADALQLRPADMTPAASTRVGHALRKLGWTPRRLRNGGPRVRLYRPEEWWSANKAEWDDDSPESEAQGEREAQGEPAPATPAAEEATAAPAHPGQPDDGIGWDEKGEPAHRDNPLSHPSHPDVYTHIRQGDGYGTGVRDHGGTAIPVLRKQGGRAGTGGTGAGEEEVDLELDDHDEPACESPDSTRGAAQ